MLGKKQVEHVLARLGLMPEGSTLPQTFPEVRCSGWSRLGGSPAALLTRSHFPLPVECVECGSECVPYPACDICCIFAMECYRWSSTLGSLLASLPPGGPPLPRAVGRPR